MKRNDVETDENAKNLAKLSKWYDEEWEIGLLRALLSAKFESPIAKNTGKQI